MVLPLALKILGLFINKKIEQGKLTKEARKAYLDFLSHIEPSLTNSARLRKSSQSQVERLKEQLKDEEINS